MNITNVVFSAYVQKCKMIRIVHV